MVIIKRTTSFKLIINNALKKLLSRLFSKSILTVNKTFDDLLYKDVQVYWENISSELEKC